MALSCCIDLTFSEQMLLLDIARGAIHAGLHGADQAAPDSRDLPPALHLERGVFVTLTRRARLRGCIGNLHPSGPLAAAVADSAYSAAFRDPRFPQLGAEEIAETSIEVSVLTPVEPMAATSRGDLLAQLQPRADGLLLQDGRHHATFLPKVWEQLPEPEDFLAQLFVKAGLPADHWSPTLRVHRYQTLTFGDATVHAMQPGKRGNPTAWIIGAGKI